MVWLMTYPQCTHLHTASCSFIIFLVQSNIYGNSKVIDVFFQLNAIFVWFESLHIFAALTFILRHSHSSFRRFHQTSSLPFIFSSIQLKIVGNSKVRAVFLLNAIFIWFDSLNIFLHSPSYFITPIHPFVD